MENEVISYSVTDGAIAVLSEKYLPLVINGVEDRAGYALVHQARMDIKSKRVEVEKTRKDLKEGALRYGQKVDAEARRITALLKPIEDHLDAEESRIDAEKARIRREDEAKKMAVAQARVEELAALGFMIPLLDAREMSVGDYQSLLIDAQEIHASQLKQAEVARLEREKREAEEKAERARLKQEAEDLAARLRLQEAEAAEKQRQHDLEVTRLQVEAKIREDLSARAEQKLKDDLAAAEARLLEPIAAAMEKIATAGPKPVLVEVFESNEFYSQDGRDFYQIKIAELGIKMHFHDGEPEDATLARDFNDVYGIPDLIAKVAEAAAAGRKFQIIRKEVSDFED
jgi:hypothetical protein